MPLLNASGWGAIWTPLTWAPHRHSACCIVQVRCALVADGVCTPLEDQPVPAGPTFVDDDASGPPLLPGAYGPPKPKVDVLLKGSCQLPKAADEATVTLGLGAWQKQLVVTGERRWEKKLFGHKPTPAKPFSDLPLDARQAFGGPQLAQNPWGTGHAGHGAGALPRIEYPKHRIDSPKGMIPPAGFGVIHPGHPRRVEQLGTVDASWARERFPLQPANFDPAAANVAPLDQQLEQVDGDEALWLEHLIPGAPDFRTRLPGIKPRWIWAPVDALDRARELDLMLDTVAIDADEQTVDLVWRGVIPLANDEELPTLDHYCTVADGKPLAQLIDDWRSQHAGASELLERRAAVVAAVTDRLAELPEPAADWDRARVESMLAGDRDFSAAVLDGLDLSELDFSDAIMPGASLVGTNLTGATLTRAVLTKAVMREAQCRGADLTEADLRNADCSQADLTDATLSGADASLTLFSGATATGLVAVGLIGFGSDGADCQATGADLSGADLIEATWPQAHLVEATLDGANAQAWQAAGVDLQGASLRHTGVRGGRLAGGDLRGAILDDSTWVGADLSNVKLDAASCAATDFTAVAAPGVQAALIDAKRAIMRRADLSDGVFTDADLRQCDGWSATWHGADVTGATLHDICLHECSDLPPDLAKARPYAEDDA